MRMMLANVNLDCCEGRHCVRTACRLEIFQLRYLLVAQGNTVQCPGTRDVWPRLSSSGGAALDKSGRAQEPIRSSDRSRPGCGERHGGAGGSRE